MPINFLKMKKVKVQVNLKMPRLSQHIEITEFLQKILFNPHRSTLMRIFLEESISLNPHRVHATKLGKKPLACTSTAYPAGLSPLDIHSTVRSY